MFHHFFGGPFSQWRICDVYIDGITYNCAEQYMMAQKARLFGDEDALSRIMIASIPETQKAIGRTVKGFDPKIWNSVARDVVFRATAAKFGQNPDLMDQLLRTSGRLLVEASPTDIVWGIGLGIEDPRIHNPSLWRGTNWLGQVITEFRRSLTNE